MFHKVDNIDTFFKLIFSSVTQLCSTLCNPMDCSTAASMSQTYVCRIGDASNHLILCGPLLLLPSILPSIRVFSNDNFSISPSNEYSGLISFRTDWFDLAVQGTLKSLLQHHSSKASILPKQMYVCIRATATPLYRIVFPTKPHILFQSAPNPSPWQPFVYFLSL